jgi:hypothetical protein
MGLVCFVNLAMWATLLWLAGAFVNHRLGRYCHAASIVKSLACARTPPPSNLLFAPIHKISVVSPSACHYLVTNPARKSPNEAVSAPSVLYIADRNSHYGTLAFRLNKKLSNANVGQIYPALQCLHNCPLYEGGPPNTGASLTMLHRRAGFSENRYLRNDHLYVHFVGGLIMLRHLERGRVAQESRTSNCSTART